MPNKLEEHFDFGLAHSTNSHLNNIISVEDAVTKQYDYIIVGGGGAGCVAAYTLAEKYPTKQILLIEAGSSYPHSRNNAGMVYDGGINMPGNTFEWWDSRILGGGTAQNAMHFWGIPLWWIKYVNTKYNTNFHEFQIAEATTWIQDKLSVPNIVRPEEPLNDINSRKFKKQFPNLKYPFEEKEWEMASGGGSISTHDKFAFHSGRNVSQGFCSKLESRYINGNRASGQTLVQSKLFTNLSIVTNIQIQKIHFEGKMARKVVGKKLVEGQFFASDTTTTDAGFILKEGGELVLTCGTYRTPELLQKSGIGPAQLLNEFNIPIISENEGVGKNFWSSIYIDNSFNYTFNTKVSINFSTVLDTFSLMANKINDNKLYTIKQCYTTTDGTTFFGNQFECFTDCVKGQVNFNGTIHPTVNYGYEFSDENLTSYVKDMIDSMQMFTEQTSDIMISNQQTMSQLVRENIVSSLADTLEAEPNYKWRDHQPLVDIMKNKAMTVHYDSIHNGGTMSSAIDYNTFKVKNLNNVTVCDLSVIPCPVTGNTAGSALTIGRYVAQYIL